MEYHAAKGALVPVYALTDALVFPPPGHADQSGLLAVGGDLSPKRLVLAYSQGIFPWYNEGQPILWHSPDPRMVLWGPNLHVPRSLKKVIRRQRFEVRCDTMFEEVVLRCASVPRPDQEGTWITEDMLQGYLALHALGVAHSFEAFEDDELVGGLYGVSLGGAFFGESMFASANDASKVVFVALVQQLVAWGIELIDCQVHTDHLERFGAELWPRTRFLTALDVAMGSASRQGTWQYELG
jgi:leucyl/phenylalanyl-tRNA---protein transferase